MLAFESVTYLFVAQKHLFEARLRGAQKMGLYLASSLGQIALNLLACVILVPRIGFAGFWMSSWISAPIGMLLAAALGEPLRYFAPAPLIGGLASPIRRGGIPPG